MITTDTRLPLASKGLSQLEPLYSLALLKLPIYESPLPMAIPSATPIATPSATPSAIPMAIPMAIPNAPTHTLTSTPCKSCTRPVGDRRKLHAKVLRAVKDAFLLSSVGINGIASKYEGCSQSVTSS